VELVRSADAFAGSILVNGHGGNHTALSAAAGALREEGRRVLVWSPSARAFERAGHFRPDAHAGRSETSIMLAIAPETVRMDRAEAGDPRPIGDLLEIVQRDGIACVSPNGVLGDPAGATAEEGEALLAALTIDLVEAVAEWDARAEPAPVGIEAR
jgi:creatinine amidohydrolase